MIFCANDGAVGNFDGYRFAPEIISHAVWQYYRFALSFRDVEDLLAKRGILVSYESKSSHPRLLGCSGVKSSALVTPLE